MAEPGRTTGFGAGAARLDDVVPFHGVAVGQGVLVAGDAGDAPLTAYIQPLEAPWSFSARPPMADT